MPWRSARNLGAGLDLLRRSGPLYGWIRWRDERAWARPGGHATRVYEAIWRDAAGALGAEVLSLGDGYFEVRRGDRWTRTWMHWVMLDDIVTVRLALDKTMVGAMLAGEGLPTPEQREFGFRDLAPAREFLGVGTTPCVVKPASGTSGGEGVTSGVRSFAELQRAALRASRGDTRLLIERQAPGDAYRLLFLDGELLDVVRRRPPSVVGDGASTVAGLIAAENHRRTAAGGRLGLRLLKVDLDCALALERAGLRLSSVPEAGRTVVLKGVVSQNAAEQNETVTEAPAGELVAEATAGVRRAGLRLAGVDLHTPDLGRSLRDAGGAIIEINGTPGLHYHYQVADEANASRVAVPILEGALDG